ncbi:hypothetical protein B0A49_00694 [Cryomyces minteri]|uniref:Phosphatidic acid phosphatase type 2/haloperoxidase domain-containing protein n=1 Tax=Cryomyces minteri TaxID=331657 RepID=A0A4U0XP41_9PEZI|nr:hypothetical protein B0A49_00694 [Cryomyces minteri]
MELPSKRLLLSYVFDWVVIIVIAAIGGGINSATPFQRPFSLLDLSISYPYKGDTVSTTVLLVVSLVAPGIIIPIICLLFVPGPAASRGAPKSLIWRRKLWEWFTGWTGLALGLAIAFFITQGMKNLFGKPRPDLLQLCQPDLGNIARHVVGGYGQEVSSRWTLVSSTICQQPSKSILNDGFRSFPSGHASFSWAGMLYLTLFLASKFSISIPYLAPRAYSSDPRYTAVEHKRFMVLPSYGRRREESEFSNKTISPDHSELSPIIPIRNQAAAPPNYVLVIAFIPIATAIYICSSRFTDFKHHGFDIISGSIIGILSSWFAFRWYHLPIRQGAGWAWGARTRDRAFGIGVGTGSYVGGEGWASKSSSTGNDIEMGVGARELGHGTTDHLPGNGVPPAQTGAPVTGREF